MQEWLDNNDILMYSTYNEGKSVIAKYFIKTLKAKIYLKMAPNEGQLKTLGTQMGYPIGVPIWVLQKNPNLSRLLTMLL